MHEPSAERTPGGAARGWARSRGRWVLGAGVVLIALLVTLGIRGLATAQAAAAQPARIAARYCAAVLARDYTTEGALLSASARGGATAQQFVADERVRESVDGRITACHAGSAVSGQLGALNFALSSPRQVSVPVTLTRAHLGTRSGAVTLARVGSGWNIAGLSAPLQGTSLAPLHVADGFCGALAAGKYADAFAALSARQQQLEKTVKQFTAQATQPAGATFTGCTPNYATYALTGASAKLALTINVRVDTLSATPTIAIAATMTLVEQGGAWKVDGLDLPAQA